MRLFAVFVALLATPAVALDVLDATHARVTSSMLAELADAFAGNEIGATVTGVAELRETFTGRTLLLCGVASDAASKGDTAMPQTFAYDINTRALSFGDEAVALGC